MSALGTQLENLCKMGRQEILLVAPFMKAATLGRLLACVEPSVSIRCVTRWRLDEIVAGVSDLEVWPLLRSRAGASLLIRSDLHAKYYRADNNCLVGSANVTETALGWSHKPNLELLVPLPAPLEMFEAELLRGCVSVDDDLHIQISIAVQQLRKEMPPPISVDTDLDFDLKDQIQYVPQKMWLPTLRYPADLYVAYAGRVSELATATRMAALADLTILPVPPGLSRVAFDTCVGSLLLSQPLIRRVDTFVAEPQRFGAVRDLINAEASARGILINAERAWQTLMRWLLHFLPTRYRLLPSRHSEVFQRIS